MSYFTEVLPRNLGSNAIVIEPRFGACVYRSMQMGFAVDARQVLLSFTNSLMIVRGFENSDDR